MTAMLSVERCIDELRRGRPLCIDAAGSRLAMLPLDLADDGSLDRFAAAVGAPLHLLITGQRAAVLNITNLLGAAGQPAVAIVLPQRLSVGTLLAIVDPVTDLATPFKGPFHTAAPGNDTARRAAISLVKLARLLPAALVAPVDVCPQDWLEVTAAKVEAYPEAAAAQLHIVARARVPLLAAEDTEVIAFRANDGALEHLALVIGDPPRTAPVLTRLHSECFTGDLLGSLKCDCGPQLQGALAAIRAEGAGVLLYLAQEGRGIGLINKLRAYALQDQGFDTVDANTRLGFENDERIFAPAARMLHLLGIGAVRLMTNNPDKVTALAALGITISERVPHQFPSNDHNRFYLATKQARSGHLLR